MAHIMLISAITHFLLLLKTYESALYDFLLCKEWIKIGYSHH